MNNPLAYLKTKLQDRDNRNIFFLILDGGGSAMGSIGIAFIATYALRLGATNTDIGLLSSLPALLIIFSAIPIGRFLNRQRNIVLWNIAGMTLYYFGYGIMALIPFVHISFISAGLLVVILHMLLMIPNLFHSICYPTLIAATIPEDRRPSLFTFRNVLSATIASVGVFFAGLWLDSRGFPGNYQVLFVFGAVFSLISLFFYTKIDFPEKVKNRPPQASDDPSRVKQSPFQFLVDLYKNYPAYRQMTINTILAQSGIYVVGVLYVIYYVRELNASDGWIGLSATVSGVGSIVGMILGRRLIERWREEKFLKVVAPILGIYPFLIGLTPSLTAILFILGFYTIISAPFSIAQYATLIKVMPAGKEQDSYALWTTITNSAAFVGPIIGVTLANWLGVVPVLLVFGILAVIGSFSYTLFPIFKKSVEIPNPIP